jgi:hypothetical protein
MYNNNTIWRKNIIGQKNIIEGLENQDGDNGGGGGGGNGGGGSTDISSNNTIIGSTLNGTVSTMQNILDVIKGPIMNQSNPEDLPPNVTSETAFYTYIRNDIATPFVKSFIYDLNYINTNDISLNYLNSNDISLNGISDTAINKTLQNINKYDISLNDTVINDPSSSNNSATDNTTDLSKQLNLGSAGNYDLNLGDNQTANDILAQDAAILQNSQNIANLIYFILLIPIIYIAWFNWTYLLIPNESGDIIKFLDTIIPKNETDPVLTNFKQQLVQSIGKTKLDLGDVKIHDWRLCEYIEYLTTELDAEKYKKYEDKYGPKQENGFDKNTGKYKPSYLFQCVKYFLFPIQMLDRAMNFMYCLLQLSCFDTYSLTSIAFLKLVFLFFLWGALETDFLTQLTDNLLGTSMTTPMPFSINADGSFSAGIGPANVAVNLTDMTNTISGNFGTNQSSVLVLSLLMMFLFLSFWGSLIYDFVLEIMSLMKNNTGWISLFWFVFKWFCFISFITNFSFFIFIFAWFYLVIMTFFGYLFARNNVKHDYFGDFFKNTYSNILQLDLTRLELIQQLKNLRNPNDGNQRTLNQIVDNIGTYYGIQNSIISVVQYTKKNPFLTGLIIFITFCFTTVMIETGQIANVSISFFIFNLLLLFIFIFSIVIIYFAFNLFRDYNNFSNNDSEDKSKSLKESFKNMFNDIIGNTPLTTTTTTATTKATQPPTVLSPPVDSSHDTKQFHTSFTTYSGGGGGGGNGASTIETTPIMIPKRFNKSTNAYAYTQ